MPRYEFVCNACKKTFLKTLTIARCHLGVKRITRQPKSQCDNPTRILTVGATPC
jgi:hypothetical protein